MQHLTLQHPLATDLLQIGAKYLLRIHLNIQRAVIGMNSPLPFIPCDARAWDMAQNRSARYPLFRQRWFADEVILTCVRWYLRFKLSYRDLAELARELGVRVAPSTILRWVIRYVPEFEKCWAAYELPVGDSWRVDETYLKVRGQWVYLYRAVDKEGNRVESYLSRTRDVTAAKA